MDPSDIDIRFRFHPANEHTGPKHAEVRELCGPLAQAINEICPDGREKSLAITKLEEAMFWANAAIAREAAQLHLAQDRSEQCRRFERPHRG